MNRFDLNASRDDSSANTEHSAASITKKPPSLVRLPSMYSPESKASSSNHGSPIPSDSSRDDASRSDASHATSASDIDYNQLPVSDEVKELFQIVDSYQPVELDLETPLKCFLPSYIPSVGDVDPIIKIPRPDGVPDGLGTVILDEAIPSDQSNAAVIELQLRNRSNKRSSINDAVHSISDAAKNKGEIDRWIRSVDEINEAKLPSEVRYRNKLPSVQELMRAWPKEIKDELRSGTLELPSADIDLSVKEYAQLMCSLLGIPVYDGSLIQSVHALMSLYVEVQRSNGTYAS